MSAKLNQNSQLSSDNYKYTYIDDQRYHENHVSNSTTHHHSGFFERTSLFFQSSFNFFSRTKSDEIDQSVFIIVDLKDINNSTNCSSNLETGCKLEDKCNHTNISDGQYFKDNLVNSISHDEFAERNKSEIGNNGKLRSRDLYSINDDHDSYTRINQCHCSNENFNSSFSKDKLHSYYLNAIDCKVHSNSCTSNIKSSQNESNHKEKKNDIHQKFKSTNISIAPTESLENANIRLLINKVNNENSLENSLKTTGRLSNERIIQDQYLNNSLKKIPDSIFAYKSNSSSNISRNRISSNCMILNQSVKLNEYGTSINDESTRLINDQGAEHLPKLQVYEDEDGQLIALNNGVLELYQQLRDLNLWGKVAVELVPESRIPPGLQRSNRLTSGHLENNPSRVRASYRDRKTVSKNVSSKYCANVEDLDLESDYDQYWKISDPSEPLLESKTDENHLHTYGNTDDDTDNTDDDDDQFEYGRDDAIEGDASNNGISDSDYIEETSEAAKFLERDLKALRCLVCNRPFMTSEDIIIHQLNSKHFWCNLCGRIFFNLDDQLYHSCRRKSVKKLYG